MNDKRRLFRKRPSATLHVTDTMTEQVIGHLGDVSLEGMMLIAHVPIVDGAVYQVAFQLPDTHGRLHRVEVGIHETWSERSRVPGQVWAGFRFIDIDADGEATLRGWLKQESDSTR